MATKEEYALEASLAAIEFMIYRLYNASVAHLSEAEIEAEERRTIERLSKTTIPQADPAQSDHMSDEFASAVQRLQRVGRSLRETPSGF